MAKNSIKGITIQIGGDTTGLDKALKDVNKKSRDLSSELKAVDKALKLNPNNLTLVKQKQELLSNSIKNTSEKLKTLEDAQSQVKKQFKSGTIDEGQYRAFQRELESTKQKLSSLKDEKKNIHVIGTAFKSVKETVEPVTGKVKKVGSAIGKVGSVAGKAGTKVAKFSVTLGKIDTAMIGKAADGFKKYTKSLTVGATAITAALSANVEASREWNNDMTKLKTNADTSGNDFDLMKSKMEDLVAVTGESDSSIEALSNLMAIGLSDEQMTPTINALSGAVEKFPDTLKIESLSDSLQETIATGAATGQFSELIGRMGGDVEAFNKGLENCTTTAERQQYALDWLANSGLSEINEEYQKSNKSTLDYERASFRLQDALANLGTAFTPVMAGAKGLGADLLEQALPAVKGLAGGLTELTGGASDLLAAYKEGGIDGLIEQIPETIDNLINTAISGITSKAPTLITAATTVLTTIILSLAQNAPQLIDTLLPVLLNGFFGLINALVSTIPTLVPALIDGAITLFLGLIDGLNHVIEQLMPMLPDIITHITNVLKENLPTIIEGGFQLLIGLIQGIADCTPQLIDSVIELIPVITDALVQNIPTLIQAGMELIMALAEGLPEAIPAIIEALPEIIGAIWDGIKEVDWLELGGNILEGILAGLKAAVSGIWEVVKDVGSDIIDGFCSFFDINSPSRVMADRVGEFLPPGIAVGMEDTADVPVEEAEDIVNRVAGVTADVDPITLHKQIQTNFTATGRTNANVQQVMSLPIANTMPESATFVLNINGQQFAQATVPFMDAVFGECMNLQTRGVRV